MSGSRFKLLLATTAILIVLAGPSHPAFAGPTTGVDISAAVPMPEPAGLPPPSIDDLATVTTGFADRRNSARPSPASRRPRAAAPEAVAPVVAAPAVVPAAKSAPRLPRRKPPRRSLLRLPWCPPPSRLHRS
jgi:hypothetical protein